MAIWKRLTRSDGQLIDVNMDTVLHMQGFKDHTNLHFAVSAKGSVYSVSIKETPHQVHVAQSLRP